jgi:hypothetical protein
MTTHTVAPNAISHALSGIASSIKTVKPVFVYTPKNFDPIEYIKRDASHDAAKFRMLSYMAWSLDNLLVRQLTTLFFDVQRDIIDNGGTDTDGNSIDSYNDFLRAMEVREARERNLDEQGFLQSGGVKLVQQLMVLRIDWHDIAADQRQAAMPTMRAQPYPTIESLIRNQQLPEVSQQTKAKFQALAKYDAGEDAAPELVKEYFDAYMLRATQDNEHRFQRAKERVNSLVGLAEYVLSNNMIDTVDFVDLPKDARLDMMNAAVRACDAGVKELITNRKVAVEDMVPGKKMLAAAKKEIESLIVQLDSDPLGPEHGPDDDTSFEDGHKVQPGLLGTHDNPSPAKHDQRQLITSARAD